MPTRTFVALAIATLASVAGLNPIQAQSPTRIAVPPELKDVVLGDGTDSEPMQYTLAKWANSSMPKVAAEETAQPDVPNVDSPTSQLDEQEVASGEDTLASAADSNEATLASHRVAPGDSSCGGPTCDSGCDPCCDECGCDDRGWFDKLSETCKHKLSWKLGNRWKIKPFGQLRAERSSTGDAGQRWTGFRDRLLWLCRRDSGDIR